MRYFAVIVFCLAVVDAISLAKNVKQSTECRDKLRAAKVVIVGAGMAGLSAARELFWQGFENVVLLEGNDRIGGRIYTIPQSTGGVLEMGAQWIHGELGNPLYRMAWNNNLLYEWAPGEERHPAVSYHLIDGSLVPKQVVDRTFQIIDNIFHEAETLIDNLNGVKIFQVISGRSMKKLRVKKTTIDEIDYFAEYRNHKANPLKETKTVKVADSTSCAEISFGAYVRTMFLDHLNRIEPPEDVRRWMEALYGWRMRWENTESSCPSLDDMSFPAWNDYVQPPGEMDVELGSQGYSGILNVVMDEIPPAAIHLKNQVQKIDWKNSDIKITTKAGDVLTADNVIVTSSLGNLKVNHNNLFDPALPANKSLSISRLGFGTVDKIFLFFNELPEAVNMAWHSTDDFHPQINGKKYENEWYRALYSFNPILQHKNILIAFIAGAEAQGYEASVSDEDALEVCHQLLKKFSGDQEYPRPYKILRTKWYSDEYANGSYSYRKVGSTMKDSNTLAEPVYLNNVPKLLFAGEATHSILFSTTTGAYESGLREATRLTNYYCPGLRPEVQE